VIEAGGLMVFFENVLAVNDVSLRCGDGQVVGVFGANSAGKSTLASALSGIILDVQAKERMRGGQRITVFGEILWEGEPVHRLPAHRRARLGIVLCPERRRLFAECTVLENLRIGGHLATRTQARDTLEFVLEVLPPLRGLLARPAGLLSGGEQQMAAIGRALMAQPRLLLLDEPLLGLAPAVQSAVVGTITAIREQKGIAVIVAEQYAAPVMPIVDYAYILENGSTVLEGTRDELLDDPDVRSAYFGA
jgi:branched-chain amino acid transport system ATP-binding protein